MIHSFRWNNQAHLLINDVPDGTYSVWVYVMEDTKSQTFDVLVEEMPAVTGLESGTPPLTAYRRVVIDVRENR